MDSMPFHCAMVPKRAQPKSSAAEHHCMPGYRIDPIGSGSIIPLPFPSVWEPSLRTRARHSKNERTIIKPLAVCQRLSICVHPPIVPADFPGRRWSDVKTPRGPGDHSAAFSASLLGTQ